MPGEHRPAFDAEPLLVLADLVEDLLHRSEQHIRRVEGDLGQDAEFRGDRFGRPAAIGCDLRPLDERLESWRTPVFGGAPSNRRNLTGRCGRAERREIGRRRSAIPLTESRQADDATVAGRDALEQALLPPISTGTACSGAGRICSSRTV